MMCLLKNPWFYAFLSVGLSFLFFIGFTGGHKWAWFAYSGIIACLVINWLLFFREWINWKRGM